MDAGLARQARARQASAARYDERPNRRSRPEPLPPVRNRSHVGPASTDPPVVRAYAAGRGSDGGGYESLAEGLGSGVEISSVAWRHEWHYVATVIWEYGRARLTSLNVYMCWRENFLGMNNSAS